MILKDTHSILLWATFLTNSFIKCFPHFFSWTRDIIFKAINLVSLSSPLFFLTVLDKIFFHVGSDRYTNFYPVNAWKTGKIYNIQYIQLILYCFPRKRLFSIVDFHEIKSVCWHFIVLENLVESEHYKTLRKLAHKSGKWNATTFSLFSSFENNETLEGG